jgi:hypothetical protein
VSRMDDDQLTDLKQFIVATVSQATADLPRRDEVVTIVQTEIRKEVDALRKEMHQGFADIQEAIGEALTASNDATDQQLQNHEQRITRLEKQATA